MDKRYTSRVESEDLGLRQRKDGMTPGYTNRISVKGFLPE